MIRWNRKKFNPEQLQILFPASEVPLEYKPGMQPRPYQEEAINNTFELFDSGATGVLLRLFTGAGKTSLASWIVQRWLKQGDDYHALVFAHERQLVWQFAKEMRKTIGINPGIEMADLTVRDRELPRVVIASRATLLEREDDCRVNIFDPSRNWLLIFDEAHRHPRGIKSVSHIVQHFEINPRSRRLGITATPERTDKRSLAAMFPEIGMDYRLCSLLPSERNAVDEGWAVPYDQRYIKVHDIDFKTLNQVKGDFDQAELAGLILRQRTLASLCEPLLSLAEQRRTIIFSVNKETAKAVAHYINAQLGREAAKWLTGNCKESHRRKVFTEHQSGVFQFLSVCGLCREGYDDPSIACVAIFRPTKSRPLAEQMKGRGCRPLKGLVDGIEDSFDRREAIMMSAKPNCMIVDLVGATGLGDCASTESIYAASLPDDLKELTQQKMLDGETDWRRAYRDAQEELERQKAEKAKADRELDEKRAQERAEKLAKAGAHVTWSQRIMAGLSTSQQSGRTAQPFTMSFGKYRGQLMSSLPAGYLAWMLKTIPIRNVRAACEREVRDRLANGDAKMRWHLSRLDRQEAEL